MLNVLETDAEIN